MSDDDIEFLDEDADIVQQCVQSVQLQSVEEPPVHIIPKPQTPMLIERPTYNSGRPAPKRKRKDEEDEDYDPIVDSPYYRNRRYMPPKVSNVRKYELNSRSSQHSTNTRSQSPPVVRQYRNKNKQFVRKPALTHMLKNRRDMTIRVPDFDDPLCLPVRALVKDENDGRRLRHWNQLCMEQFKKNETPLRLSTGPVTSSKRTIVIRNMFNKFSGKTETTFWNRIKVQGKPGDTKADVTQSVLPRYREKKILNAYKLKEQKRNRSFQEKYEVILTKETYGDEETLVAYKPDNSLAMIFKMFEREGESGEGQSDNEGAVVEHKRHLQEMASCSSCALCYQASWRARSDTIAGEGGLVNCPICTRVCLSAHALVTHVKTHARHDVRRHRSTIVEILAKLLPYHYRCRVCQEKFPAVRELRRHLPTHNGVGELFCEVGNHAIS